MGVTGNECSIVDNFFKDSFETYKTCPLCIITEFECKVYVQNHEFGWVRFQNRFFINCEQTMTKNRVKIQQ